MLWKQHIVSGYISDVIYTAENNEGQVYVFDGECLQVFNIPADYNGDPLSLLDEGKPILCIDLPAEGNILPFEFTSKPLEKNA